MHYPTNTIRVLEINPSADLSDTVYTVYDTVYVTTYDTITIPKCLMYAQKLTKNVET